jgi:putative ABC transport system ATP-binding protein
MSSANDLPEAAVLCVGVWKVHPSAAGPVRALCDVSLSLPAQTLTWVRGASGSGKSTLLALIGALDPPTRGRVTTLGVPLETLSPGQGNSFRRQYIGYLMPDLGLVAHLTAIENVSLALMFDDIPLKTVRDSARHLLDEVEMGGRADHRPEQMSLGERSRVLLARALAGAPRLVLADEPTANLDSENAIRVMNLLQAQTKKGRTIVVASHDDRLARFADAKLELSRGCLVNFDQPSKETT